MTDLYVRYPKLLGLKADIDGAFELLVNTFENGHRLYVCGNGGSASDGEHIVGELMKSFKIKRPVPEALAKRLADEGEKGTVLAKKLERALPAISLNTYTALASAYINDNTPELVYAQLLYGLAEANDTLLAISTSGNSANCVYAALTAKALGVRVLALTGDGGGKLGEYADIKIAVPERETYLVQELHLPVYHELCARLEAHFFG